MLTRPNYFSVREYLTDYKLNVNVCREREFMSAYENHDHSGQSHEQSHLKPSCVTVSDVFCVKCGGSTYLSSTFPLQDKTFDIGSSNLKWRNMFADKAFFDTCVNVPSITWNTLTVALSANGIVLNGSITPQSTATFDLGSHSQYWQKGHINNIYTNQICSQGAIFLHATMLPGTSNINLGSDAALFKAMFVRCMNVTEQMRVGNGCHFIEGSLKLGCVSSGSAEEKLHVYNGNILVQNCNAYIKMNDQCASHYLTMYNGCLYITPTCNNQPDLNNFIALFMSNRNMRVGGHLCVDGCIQVNGNSCICGSVTMCSITALAFSQFNAGLCSSFVQSSAYRTSSGTPGISRTVSIGGCTLYFVQGLLVC